MNLASGERSPFAQNCCTPSAPRAGKKQRLFGPSHEGRLTRYTDADLAADMNALTYEERRVMEEDIHGVGDVVEETDEMLEANLAEMRIALDRIPDSAKIAWDRAVFLRPSLATDRSLHLMLLRAARFDVPRAATLLVHRFEEKRFYFGDDLLIHRITWDDLTPEEHAFVRSGSYQLIPDRDRTGRGITYSRLCNWDVSDPFVFGRCMYYIGSALEGYPEMQRKGIVSIGDFRGKWKSSFLQVIKVIGGGKDALDNLPYHNATSHLLYDDANVNTFIQGIRAVLNKEHRLRHRFHNGSALEIDYSLRSFGINLSDCLPLDSTRGPMSAHGIEQDIQRRQKMDEEWRQSEAPYRDPASRKALSPNPQDIILGRNKKIAAGWRGNIAYNQLIEKYVSEYIAVGDQDRIAKTAIAIQVVRVVRYEFKARFLSRKDTEWEVMDDIEAQRKVSQALRNAARESKVAYTA